MLKAYADQWALVTGASSGIGAEFARQLAARGMHLVLVARREGHLKDLADELHRAHGTKCKILVADLSRDGEPTRVVREVRESGLCIELLVNNAGFGCVAEIDNTSPEVCLRMLHVNVCALTELTLAFLPEMTRRGSGGVINVGSVAGFQPVAYMGVYAASKAYVLHFSEALWAEARQRGVTVTTLCPGPTRTEFFDVAGVPERSLRSRLQDVKAVVRTGLKAFEKGRSYVIPGWGNYILSLLVRLATRATVVKGSMAYFRPRK